MASESYSLGMVGLGVMGANLSLNMAEHGFSVAGLDTDVEKARAFSAHARSGAFKVRGFTDAAEFVHTVRTPRAIFILVPAGPPVDAVIHNLLPFLEQGDLLIDGGNSFYKDTELRSTTLTQKGIQFMGMGISGGEMGARHGPSLMPGGPLAAYPLVQPVLEAVAAQVDGQPCAAYLGPRAAGHYVKMVHNGIEYGLMELIAESYDLLKRGAGLNDDELHDVFAAWNQTELNAYLIEISADIFTRPDPHSRQRLIDVILDEARQKGTGMWTSMDAMELAVPAPVIDAAVAMRSLSTCKAEREVASRAFQRPIPSRPGERENIIAHLKAALYVGMILTFTQGMALLQRASQVYSYRFHLETVARIWHGGCIIRAALLEKIRAAFAAQPALENLLMDPAIGDEVWKRQEALRGIVQLAAELGIPAPAFSASLAYFDALRSPWLPANLIQAQRDYFGAHSYERIDEKGHFHTRWSKE
ncbi:MAG TPA: NADP-dependent phosphogluconate dehydrogenase [Anaerolineaceae bacterium]|nr:NADP-dependent phosphogluconate dehydrogenase [Anaerolineaceae bacterium]